MELRRLFARRGRIVVVVVNSVPTPAQGALVKSERTKVWD